MVSQLCGLLPVRISSVKSRQPSLANSSGAVHSASEFKQDGYTFSFINKTELLKLEDKLALLELSKTDIQYLERCLKTKNHFVNDDSLYHAGKLKDGRVFIITKQGYIYLGKPNELKQLTQVESKHFHFQDPHKNKYTYRTLADDSTESLFIMVATVNNQIKADFRKIIVPNFQGFPITTYYESLPINFQLQLNSAKSAAL